MADDQLGPEEPRTQGGGCAKGCLIALAVILALGAIAAILVFLFWRPIASSMGVTFVEAAIRESGMPEAEHAEVMVEVRRLADAWKNQEISDQQFTRIVEGFADSPLMASIKVFAIESQYFDASGLTDEEKTEARVALDRFARGIVNKQIDKQAQDGVFAHVSEIDAQGDRALRETVTDEELRAFIADAKAAADEAGVPEEVEPVDPSEELQRIIDEAMQAPAQGRAPPMEAPADASEAAQAA